MADDNQNQGSGDPVEVPTGPSTIAPQASQVAQAQSAQVPSPDLSAGGQQPQDISQLTQTSPDLPRFQRTFGNTLKGMLVGFGLGGVPGMVAGGISPTTAQEALDNRKAIARANVATAQANQTFANARAAHEVAMAHQADAEYQALPEKLQQEATQRGFATLTAARQAGYLPIASVALDEGQDQNSQNAMTALNSIKQQFGAVPQGLLYVHTGNTMTVMKLQNPAASLDLINQVRMASGMPQLSADAFQSLSPAARDSMARDAVNFTDPRDTNGMVTQQSLNSANMRLMTVKAQPDFNGKDAIVSQLQATVDHQKAVLDSGAAQDAIRKGQAAGAEAQAAQPGKTAATIADINATAGPKANAAALEAGAAQKAKNQADMAAMQGNQDAFGNQIGVTPEGQQLNLKEYNSRADKFAKDYVQPLTVLQKTNAEFQRINSNPNQTGAEKVTALLNAVGISGDPLKGKGFRISNDVINEHAQARNIWESGVQKLNTIAGSGGPITSQQIADYTAVAQGVVHDAYVTAAQEAQRQGLPVNFLPKATQQGQAPDRFTAKIYLDAAGGNVAKAHKAMVAAGWAQ